MTPPAIQPLRLAFLGADENTPELARAAIESNRYTLAGVCEFEIAGSAPSDDALRVLIARARRFDHWEALLDQQQVDAVIVARARDEDLRAEQLRKLIQVGLPLLVSHPVVESMLIYYELDMIRRETGCVVLPYLPQRHHPAARKLAEMIRQRVESPIGKVEQVVMQRCLADPTKAVVTSQFAVDVDLLRSVAGDMTRLGAMGGASDHAVYASLGVHMSSPAGIAARWSVDPNESARGAHITLLGSRGRATLNMPADRDSWTLDLTVDNKTESQSYPAWDPAAVALQEWDSAIRGAPAEPDWVDACRSVELAETIERSLRKSRMIELYYEDYTEEGTFKGTMTSLGCGLLVLGMVLLAVVAIAEQAGVPYVKGWPYAFIGVFGLFLLLQLLMLVFRRPEAGSDAGTSGSAPPGD